MNDCSHQNVLYIKSAFKQNYLMFPYAELHCISNFSFLRGASHPEELVARAAELGYTGIAITDECSLAGVVRAHSELKRLQALTGEPAQAQLPQLLLGSEFALTEQERIVLIAQNRNGYGNLSSLITRARRRADKGQYKIELNDFLDVPDCLAIYLPAPHLSVQTMQARLLWLREQFGDRLWLGVELLLHGNDAALLERARHVSQRSGVPMVAAGDVHFHRRARKAIHDTLLAIDQNMPVHAMGLALQPNAEQHLRSRLRIAQIYPAALLEETIEIVSRCQFSLDELRYEYPEEIVPDGFTPTTWLRHLTYVGAKQRFEQGIPESVIQQIEHELALITELNYEPYFLTVADIVHFARSQGILCQGRGSAANSAVCYCCGITEVDPARSTVLFERFISRERNEPPDIDVDFEHQRREEVIQYIYTKYGRHRAALTATVVSYRPRSVLRDVGKALGIDAQRIEQLAKSRQWWDGKTMRIESFAEAGFDPESSVVRHWISLSQTLMGFPRHLSQHVGGFVIARDDLSRLVPIENAAMADRSVIQWDKDDLDALGLLKVDVLALGMLSAIRRALDQLGMRIQDIPAEDPATYEMICRADTVGVFQIESRAQMSMLPRLQPRCFYDLVIEVAIVRPGPIQGGMVHPYLRRRQGLEQVYYPRPEIKPALARTLGIPIFQEQVMQIAIIAAGFSPGEADQLRRAMAAWNRKGGLGGFYERVVNGMLERGYEREFAESIFRQIEGFGEYGFPESHAASFALLVYVSCWIKQHHPAVFLIALLNSQPMGFYAPAQLVRDAREHGVTVLGVEINISVEDCVLEACSIGTQNTTIGPVRLGLSSVNHLSRAGIERALAARLNGHFLSVEDLARRAKLDQRDLQALAAANALHSLAGHRHQAVWEASALKPLPELLQNTRFDEAAIELPAPSVGQDTVADYQSLGIPMGAHPLALLRPVLTQCRSQPASVLRNYPSGRIARASGLVTHRQRPETAKGTVFVTLEDESGAINVIVWPDVLVRYRKEVLGARLMTVYGVWQCDEKTGGQVMHLLAQRVVDHTHLLGTHLLGQHSDASPLSTHSRDFR
jgi:error-prone DNA polymerase